MHDEEGNLKSTGLMGKAKINYRIEDSEGRHEINIDNAKIDREGHVTGGDVTYKKNGIIEHKTTIKGRPYFGEKDRKHKLDPKDIQNFADEHVPSETESEKSTLNNVYEEETDKDFIKKCAEYHHKNTLVPTYKSLKKRNITLYDNFVKNPKPYFCMLTAVSYTTKHKGEVVCGKLGWKNKKNKVKWLFGNN